MDLICGLREQDALTQIQLDKIIILSSWKEVKTDYMRKTGIYPFYKQLRYINSSIHYVTDDL